MSHFTQMSRNELHETEGGFPIIPVVKGALLVVGVLRLGNSIYESAKDDAKQAGIRDAYIDMGLTN